MKAPLHAWTNRVRFLRIGGVRDENGLDNTDLSERFVRFAAGVIRFLNTLPDSSATRKISDQLLRSAMSVGANYEETRGAQSRNDFVHKLHIALKEIRESRYWLRLIIESGMTDDGAPLLDEATQLRSILGKSVATAKGTAR